MRPDDADVVIIQRRDGARYPGLGERREHCGEIDGGHVLRLPRRTWTAIGIRSIRRVTARRHRPTQHEGTVIPHRVPGVIARTRGAPVEVAMVNVPDPGPDEALIRVEACGVCHTDLHYREGGIGHGFPFLLGHEAAGRVEAVGAGVTNVAPGDVVVIAWRAPCGNCRSCLRGRPWYCFDSRTRDRKMTLDDGTSCRPRWASAPSPSCASSTPVRRSRWIPASAWRQLR